MVNIVLISLWKKVYERGTGDPFTPHSTRTNQYVPSNRIAIQVAS